MDVVNKVDTVIVLVFTLMAFKELVKYKLLHDISPVAVIENPAEEDTLILPLRMSNALVGACILIPILDAVNVERPMDVGIPMKERLNVDAVNVYAYT